MFNFIEAWINGSNFEKGIVVTLGGMLGVFLVLIMFFFIIKLFMAIFPYKPEEN